MSTVHEIESAVQNLSRSELKSFPDWFVGFDAEAWDRQFEEDVAGGKLDALADEAIRDLQRRALHRFVKHPANPTPWHGDRDDVALEYCPIFKRGNGHKKAQKDTKTKNPFVISVTFCGQNLRR